MVLQQTSVSELKKLVEVCLSSNDEQKYRQMKSTRYPNFINVAKTLTDAWADVELR